MRIAFLIDGGMVAWASKCQEIILLSTTESEYIVIAYFLKEVLWLQSLIRQVFVPFTDPNPLKSDNLSAIMLMQDHQYHTHTKHINIHFQLFAGWCKTRTSNLFLALLKIKLPTYL